MNYCPCGRRCHGEFCGRCRDTSHQKALRKARAIAEPLPKHCQFCGGPFPDLGATVYRNKRFCDWKCQQEARKMGHGTRSDDMSAAQIEKLIELNYQRIQRERRAVG